jgi:hypothetical protein
MKRYFFALLLCLSSWQTHAQFLYTTPPELTEIRRRVAVTNSKPNGPFTTVGDVSPNSPDDWTRVKATADVFLTDPLAKGTATDDPKSQIWVGYPAAIGVGDFFPKWQGTGAVAAAFVGKVLDQPKYAFAVKNNLLAQVRQGGNTDISKWPVPSNTNVPPTYELGFIESFWLKRLGLAYDYAKDVFTEAEQAEFCSWYNGAAWYFANRIQTRLATSLPLRLQNDWSVRAYYAKPNGVNNAGWQDPIYELDTRNIYPDLGGYKLTHRKADGTAGNKISRHAQEYSNRLYTKAGFIYLAGRITGDTGLVWHAKCIYKESIAFGLYPDGTISDFWRGGDYAVPNQGLAYSAFYYDFAALIADGEARRGNYDLYEFATRDGAHGTQCGTGQPSKTIFTAFDRLRDCMTGANPIFCGPVTPATRIDDYNDADARTLSFTYVLATPAKWRSYFTPSDSTYQTLATRTAKNALPYPANQRYFSASQLGLPWCGAGGEWPAYNLQFNRMALEVYGRKK